MRFNSALAFLILVGLLAADGTAPLARTQSKKTVDNHIYGDLLKKYVKDGLVDYRGLKTEEDRLDRYLKILEGVDPGQLGHNEQFAFYINAYNAWTLKLILSGYPGIDSIKDLGSWLNSPWKKKVLPYRRRYRQPRPYRARHPAPAASRTPGCTWPSTVRHAAAPPLRAEPLYGHRS